MSPQSPAPCPHELRPGTTVCLHCRHIAHKAQAARTRVLMLRAGTIAAAVAVLSGAVSIVRGGGSPPAGDASAAGVPLAPPDVAPGAPGADAAFEAGAIETRFVADPPVARPRALSDRPRPAGPIIPEGRTDLRGGVFAVRTGDTVVVHFDMPATRTRRRDKFEQTVRRTLPAVFGPAADSALAAVPAGRLAATGDLLTELPTRGVRLATPGGTLALWPATRPGRDGPLVVTYRATFER